MLKAIQISAKSIRAGIDPAFALIVGVLIAFLLKANNTPIAHNHRAIARNICLICNGHGHRRSFGCMKAHQVGIVGMQERCRR